jgi:RNase adapter protein RapZ
VSDILAITGLSGAGRSQAADDLEDLGWFVVDNLPPSLIEKVVELGSANGSVIDKLALVVGSPQHGDVLEVIEGLRAQGHQVRILYLDASDAELVRRYGSTRRRHPLDNGSTGVLDAIQRERGLLEGLKAGADLVIDTTMLNVHQLKALIVDRFAGDARATRMQTTIISFGYKYGIPLDVDLVFDCRFLPNPYWVERLREHTGLDRDVHDYVLDQELAKAFLDKVDDLLELLLPAYTDEGKSYLTIAVGCTGGRHRSVAIAEELGRRLRERGVSLRLSHRDLSM